MSTDEYRARAEAFVSEIRLEHYRHFAGLKDDYEVEDIYERHGVLFSREAVERLRDDGSRKLLEFAVEGLAGRATADLEARLAEREAALVAEVDGRQVPYRQLPIVQAGERDPDARAALQAARLELVERELDPLLRETGERVAALAAELGFASVLDMCEQISGVDLRKLGEQTSALLERSEAAYEPVVEPCLREHLGFGFAELRASDLAAFFRAPDLDPLFPAERLRAALADTAAGLGIDLGALAWLHLDDESRPTKSPRAFCSPARVPHEVYLVLAPHGGRDDYATLLHEAGHALHFGHVDPSLPFEDRYLGDNGVTESYAFLLEHLTADPEWLRAYAGIDEPEAVTAHARAQKLVFLRRYCAKLAYELDLHGGTSDLDAMGEAYARGISEAVHVDWPRASWLSDVDPFFYVAAYLRAWALEAHLRRHLRERFGARWFAEPEAGALLVSLWREGQRRSPEELLAQVTGAELDLSALTAELVA